MYKIIGGDGNEYGPVSAETMRQWIAENRVNGETKVRGEMGDWQPLAEFPEFGALLGAPAQPQSQAPAAAGGAPAPFPTADPREVFEGDYQLDMGGCISRGWALVKANFGVLFGGMMIYIGTRASAYNPHNSNWLGLSVGGALNSVSVNNSCKGIFSKG